VSGTPTGVARELMLTRPAGGDNKALGERLVHIERPVTALGGLALDVVARAEWIEAILRDPLQIR